LLLAIPVSESRNSIDIKGPILHHVENEINGYKDSDLVPEGTEVKEAIILHSWTDQILKILEDVLDRLDQLQVALNMKLIDTSVTLSVIE